ncbi:hypothetical protein C8J57DRAFT_1528817 [Mycena rebaudengoi]|nr:hypothetical protein C8J57DRAFT_1528817 [Mycena rebaudengoi]
MFSVFSGENSPRVVDELPPDLDAALTSLFVLYELTPKCRLGNLLLSAPACVVRLDRLHIKIQSAERLLLAAAPFLQHLKIDEESIIVISDSGGMPAFPPPMFPGIAGAHPRVEVISINCSLWDTHPPPSTFLNCGSPPHT